MIEKRAFCAKLSLIVVVLLAGLISTSCDGDEIEEASAIVTVSEFGLVTNGTTTCWLATEGAPEWADDPGINTELLFLGLSDDPRGFDMFIFEGAGLGGEGTGTATVDAEVVLNLDMINSACMEGVEGQHYVYMVSTTAGGAWTNKAERYSAPRDAACNLPTHVVEWDAAPGGFCTETCTGKLVDWSDNADECCGDDLVDCLAFDFTENRLCMDFIDATLQDTWTWLDTSSADYIGSVIESPCANINFLVAGRGTLKRCGGDTVIDSLTEQNIDSYLIAKRTFDDDSTSETSVELISVPFRPTASRVDNVITYGDLFVDLTTRSVTLNLSSANRQIAFIFNDATTIATSLVNPSTQIHAALTGDVVMPPFGDYPPAFDGNFEEVTNGDEIHGYACVPDTPAIYECKGLGTELARKKDFDGSTMSPLSYGDYKLNEGDSIDIGGITYYCLDRNEETGGDGLRTYFDDTLDNDPSACDTVMKPLGGGWTGSACCGDQENEFYNDIGGSGACWDNQLIDSGEFVEAADSRVAVDNGVFVGCNLRDPAVTGGIEILNIMNTREPVNLIEPQYDYDYCTVLDDTNDDGDDIQCQGDGVWNYALRLDREFYKGIIWMPEYWEVPFGCCNATECFNGTTTGLGGGCTPDQTGKPFYSTYQGLVCLDGEWVNMPFYYTPYGNSGYCPKTDNCLFSTDPSVQNNCMENGDYRLEFLCQDKLWTTRTKYMASYMLDFVNKDPNYKTNFTLFCDTHENILNYYPYTFEGVSVSQYVGKFCVVEGQTGQPCVNTFCVLKYPDGVAFGTSINTEIDDPDRSFLKAFNYDTDLCNSVTSFGKCGGAEERAFYDKNLGLLFYVPTGSLTRPSNPDNTFDIFFSEPFDDMLSLGFLEMANLREKFVIFNSTSMFNRVFIDVHDTKKIRGFLEESKPKFDEDGNKEAILDHLGVNIEGHEFDACDLDVGFYDDASCDSNNILIARVRNSDPAVESHLAGVWLDLTSKLRTR